MQHPPDWVPEFNQESARLRLERAAEFRSRWEAMGVTGDSVPNQVDYRLIGSAISRVEWEVGILRNWERDAVMQVHQALGPAYDLIVPAPPFDTDRQDSVIYLLHQVGPQLEVARENLARAGTAALAGSAVRLLEDIDEALPRSMSEVSPLFDAGRRRPLAAAGSEATRNPISFREWLRGRQDRMPEHDPVGRDAFIWFLRNVALLALSPEGDRPSRQSRDLPATHGKRSRETVARKVRDRPPSSRRRRRRNRRSGRNTRSGSLREREPAHPA